MKVHVTTLKGTTWTVVLLCLLIQGCTRHTLNVTINGYGRVTSPDVVGMNCVSKPSYSPASSSSTCSRSILSGTSFALTATEATASSGYALDAWGGDCTGTANTSNCDLTMSSPKNVEATFTNMFRLTVRKVGNGVGVVSAGVNNILGVLTSPPINCLSGCITQSSMFESGSEVIIAASPDNVFSFVTWGVPCTGGPTRFINKCLVTMGTVPVTVSVTFP